MARAGGAGEEETARRLGAQAVWLSLAFGIAVSALLAVLAEPLVSLMGGDGQAADYAVTYLRIAAIGFPAAFLALGAQGYLRGVADLRTPLVILIAGNVANVFLELLFVYGFDWGIAGSAWGTAIAQLGMGAAFVVVVLRRLEPGEARVRLALARRVLSLGKWIFIRTTALMLSFVLAGAVATRFGDASIAAHQVAFQLWIFLALVLDAVAIAGQIIVGRELGAGRTRGGLRRERADDLAVRRARRRVRGADARARGRAAARVHGRRVGARRGGAPVADLRADAAAERRGVRARRDPHRRERRAVSRAVDGGGVPRVRDDARS